jgi:hypothetical protein
LKKNLTTKSRSVSVSQHLQKTDATDPDEKNTVVENKSEELFQRLVAFTYLSPTLQPRLWPDEVKFGLAASTTS